MKTAGLIMKNDFLCGKYGKDNSGMLFCFKELQFKFIAH